jgi:uncharacterized repeat protein (TIGR01451 family)
VRRFRRVRRALPRKAMRGLLTTIVSLLLLPCAVAAANTVTSDFDNFALGTINGQQGWRSGEPTFRFDEGVVPVDDYYSGGVPGFGAQAWRFSNLVASTRFDTQTYSPALNPPTTENGPETEFIADFSFITAKTAEQPGLFVSISPDNSVGGRMSLLQLIDAAAGTEVVVWDTLPDGNFTQHEVAVLPRGIPHTIKIRMKLHPGPNNDEVAIFIDGRDVGQRFTSWENYYRHPGVNQPVPEIDSLLFRSNEPGFTETNGGYLFFGASTTDDDSPGPAEPDVVTDKMASPTTVPAGGLVRYTITARNRGSATARNFVVCDRIPRRETFVSANQRLRRIGGRRCLLIASLAPGRSMTFHLTARVNSDAPAGRVTNTTDEENAEDLTPPPLPPVPDVPGRVVDPGPAPEGGATVDVVAPPVPTVTG